MKALIKILLVLCFFGLSNNASADIASACGTAAKRITAFLGLQRAPEPALSFLKVFAESKTITGDEIALLESLAYGEDLSLDLIIEFTAHFDTKKLLGLIDGLPSDEFPIEIKKSLVEPLVANLETVVFHESPSTEIPEGYDPLKVARIWTALNHYSHYGKLEEALNAANKVERAIERAEADGMLNPHAIFSPGIPDQPTDSDQQILRPWDD